MANPEHLAILKQGVERWNKWREKHPLIRPAFSHVTLRKADLSCVDFTGADLGGADLSGADLTQARLNEAYLFGANLKRANLASANLTKANVIVADLSGANLKDANLEWATAGGTILTSVDLSATTGLETMSHAQASSVSIDTIYLSHGRIPETFLRGCGVPENFITYMHSLTRGAFEYYSCFISYSTKDQAFADRLYADLQAKGVRCWFAPHDIMGGRKVHEQIDEAIRVHDKLLLILSEYSMASDWVGTEIANAGEREAREKKQMLFPITIAPFEDVKKWKKFDADRGTDSAREIREYYIPDFSGWERDAAGYQREFEKLVTALKAVASG
jgi:hypothetical protein